MFDIEEVRETQARLAEAIASPTGLDRAALVDAIGEMETLSRTVTAAQAALTAELSEALGDTDAGVGNVVAFARRESPHRGRRHLSLARVVPVELPHTWSAWRAGRIDEWAATLIAQETACLPLTHRLAVDEAVAGDPDALESMGSRQLIAKLRAEAERLDPAACVARRRQAESERRVSIRPAPDTMAWVTALMPAKDGVAVYAVLSKHADRARSEGDPRSRGQVMADSLLAAVVGESSADQPKPSVSLGVVMSASTLFGGSDEPAHLEDFGPIPAELAREIVCGAADNDEVVALRRLFASPVTGELVSMDSTSRTFRGSLARFVRLRDRTCRTPWCDAPIRHLDHVVEDQADGDTSATNAQGLCEACNYAKTGRGWRARPEPDGSVTTMLPTGHSYSTRPPPVATITHRDLPALHIDYVLTG